MPWPLSQDYNEAIQNPAQSFADPELRLGEADTNELGLPAPRSGNFADVYAVVSGANKWAVKCFTRQIPGLQERYQQISLHLAQYKPSFMVDFSFLEQGIRVRGDWYPILKMQWVEGTTLNQFVKSNLHKPQLLNVLCQLWVKLSQRLRRVNIAHCDLQHGNVLMVPGSKKELQVKLVDYDGMCVPALTLLKSIEVGHPSYQHPQRQREGIYSLEVDRFSHLVIFTALKALTIGGKALWDKYDDGDNLLFKPADFAAPTKSRLLYELLKSSNAEVAGVARVLVQAATEPLEKAPLLEQLTPALARQTSVPASAPTTAAKTNGQEHAPAQRRSPVARKNSMMVPLAAGILLALGLAAGAAFYLLTRDSGTSPPAGAIARKNPGTIDAGPKPAVSSQPAVVDKKDLKKPTPNEPAKTGSLPSKANDSAPQPSPPQVVDKQDNGTKNLTPAPPLPTPPRKTTTNPKTIVPTPPTPPPKRPSTKPMEPQPPQKSPPRPAPAAQADGPRPVPGEVALAAALDKVKDQYKDDWNARKTKELEDLATRLLRQGQKTTNDPALQFVLLREARDKGADAADAELAMQAVDEMAKDFTVNALEEKAAALQRADHAAVGAASIKTVVETSIDVIKQAAGDDNYDVALRMLKASALSAARSGNRSLQSSVRACSDEVHSLKKEYEKVKTDLEKLAVDPSDAAANLAVGRYCCFRKKDWDKGLPYLAKGSDPQLADLANMELKEANSAAAWVKLGDGWRKLADKADGPVKTAARRKAYAWYAQAYPELTDAEAARVEKNMTKLAKEVPGLRRPWEGLDVSQAVDKKTYLVLEPGKSMSTRRQYSGPLLISATLRCEHHSLTIRAFGDGLMEFRELGLNHMLQLALPDPDPLKRVNNTMNYGARSPFVPGQRHVVQWRITESGMEVLVDGRTVFTVPRDLNLSRRGPIVITSRDATVEVLSLHVTSLK